MIADELKGKTISDIKITKVDNDTHRGNVELIFSDGSKAIIVYSNISFLSNKIEFSRFNKNGI